MLSALLGCDFMDLNGIAVMCQASSLPIESARSKEWGKISSRNHFDEK